MANSYGGQALIEGVMMRGKHTQAMCARLEDGRIVSEVEEFTLLSQRNKFFALPLVRGVCSMIDSLVSGMQAIVWSTNVSLAEDEEEEELTPMEIAITLIISIGLGVLLFFLLPMIIGGFFDRWVKSNVAICLIEGLVRMAIFLAYMIAVSRMKEMKRLFSYHGAEHKTIRCYEAGLPLTVENVRAQTRLHPRCGTSFLLVVMILSILIFSVASSVLLALVPGLEAMRGTFLYRLIMILFKLLLLPLVVSVAYECNRWVGRHDNALSRVLTAPGMWFQYFTTNEPDDSMIEVGIAAVKAVLPEQEGADRW